jgi:predicted NAD/FAD-binding protein
VKIAVVGGGIAGLVAARRLAAAHEVWLFEGAPRLGGHTYTVEVEEEGRRLPVDLGFIVYNERTYPLFSALLAELAVPTRATSMSFSVRCERTGLEYNGTSIDSLFAQRSNLLRPTFHRMWIDILRFHRRAPALLASTEDPTLDEYLAAEGFSGPLVRDYLVPMVSAIWSADPEHVGSFPARRLFTFLHNHGMLSVADRPVWRVVEGGSSQYLEPLVRPFAERVATATPVDWVRRRSDGVWLKPRGGVETRFDRVVLAVHADQAVRLLADPSDAENDVLRAIEYQPNDVVLHTDERFLPRRPKARASWNVHLNPPRSGVGPQMTYWMNLLQGLSARRNYCVTLNRTAEIDPAAILHRVELAHPVYRAATFAAQERRGEIQGVRGTYFCGAYWGYGFHEDGVRSGEEAAGSLLLDASRGARTAHAGNVWAGVGAGAVDAGAAAARPRAAALGAALPWGPSWWG